MILSELFHHFWANSPVRKIEQTVPEESTQEELVFERTFPEPDLLTQIFRLSFNVESLDTEAPEHTNNQW